jgi:predicted nucleic acid-binding protein
VSVVVSDTTPLNYLIVIGSIEVLPRLFGNVVIPPAVIAEMSHPKAPEAVAHWAAAPPGWISIQAPRQHLNLALGRGEEEAIALAEELRIRGILVDDKKARAEAKKRGISTIGTIAILDLADQARLLDFETCLDLLRATTFRMEPALLNPVRARVRARKAASQ